MSRRNVDRILKRARGKVFADLTSEDCCVVIGHDDDGAPVYCGHPRHAGFSLCKAHTRKLYHPARRANAVLERVEGRSDT